MKQVLLASLYLLLCPSSTRAATVSPLFSRGYTVLPSPQKVELGAKDIELTQRWQIQPGPGVENDVAFSELNRLLAERFEVKLGARNASAVIRLIAAPNSVLVTGGSDKDKEALKAQAYRLTIAPDGIAITGNTTTGLFYGVMTFVQLLKEQSGKLWLPEATIEDWPSTELRIIYWDDAHHLEHIEQLKAALRQASFYKVNGFALKLEGHFQYAHAKTVVDPYALSPAEMQELTDYGLTYHVQLIPYLDGPAHDAFILKHPEYADLREYPDSNYEFCSTNPKTYQLFDSMFDDLLAANKGGKYFVLSTDEPYYVGLADNSQCGEARRAKQLGSVGKLLAEFVTRTANYLHEHGRTVIFWGEYPLKPNDIGALPDYLVNGEVYGPQFDLVFRSHGIRQMAYTSTEGEERMFPQYYLLPDRLRLHEAAEESGIGRVQDMLDTISEASFSDLLGVFVAGWADAGVHPETFWLGYATGTAAGWNRQPASSEEMESSFYSLFYGRGATNIGRVYQLMSEGAQNWQDSWDTGPSTARKLIWGNSYTRFEPERPARDQFLPTLPTPSSDLLQLGSDWLSQNQKRLDLASGFLAQNSELLDLLYENLQRIRFNRYNLEIYLAIGGLYRENLFFIQDLGHIADLLKTAQAEAASGESAKAVNSLDRALDLARVMRDARNKALSNATASWYKSWQPRSAEANGRTYLHELDDVKDHLPERTVDMSYLVYRELLYPMDVWANKVVATRNRYSAAHGLPQRDFTLDWKK